MSERLRGKVIRRVRERRFGFIVADVTNEEFFYHADDLENVDFVALDEQDVVTFVPTAAPKGPRAVEVRRV